MKTLVIGCLLLLGAYSGTLAQQPTLKRPTPLKRPAPTPSAPVPHDDFFKGKLLSQTQEMLSDVVLQDALNQIWEQADKHGHEGEYNHYVNICRITVEGTPNFYSAYDTAAHLLWSTDREEEAVELLKRGLKANPNDYYFYDELGQHFLLARKDPKGAIPYYELAIKFQCPWMTHNMLATCYERTNQLDKALKALEKAATYPDNRNARRRLEALRRKMEQSGTKKQ